MVLKHKLVAIEKDLHKALKRYCLDYSLTLFEATTQIIGAHLNNNGYIKDENRDTKN